MNSEVVATLEAKYPAIGFDFTDFMMTKIMPLIHAEHEAQIAPLLQRANDYLLINRQDMEVLDRRSDEGPSGFVLRVGKASFLIGDATELTLLGDDHDEDAGSD